MWRGPQKRCCPSLLVLALFPSLSSQSISTRFTSDLETSTRTAVVVPQESEGKNTVERTYPAPWVYMIP